MSRDREDESTADALRAAGFIRVSRVWLTREQAQKVWGFKNENRQQVDAIRKEAAERKAHPAYDADDDIPDWQRERQEDLQENW